jgi:murein DD-endopeptidase MepM/ murein hydrolase activator NlpD
VSVYATAPGKVVYAGWRGRFGRFVEIDHGNGIRTRYAHLRKIFVRKGDTVANRDKIALLGTSGRSTGPHVHYEVMFKGRAVDPRKFLQAGKHIFKS